MQPSNSAATPVICFIVLLCDLSLSVAASSTRSSRSCHLAVVGDQPALPAKSPSLPAALMGVAPEWTRLNTSEQLDTRPRERPVMKTTLGPALACHHARAPSFWDAAPRQEHTDARLSTRWVMAAPMRQRAPSPEVHSHRWITLKSARVMRAAWATSGTAHGELRLAGAVSGWSDASQLPLRAEDRSESSSDMRDAHACSLHFCDSSSSTDRHGCDAITSKLNFVDKFGLLAKRLIPRQDTCSLAASLPTSRTTSRLLTSRQAAASPPGWRALAPHQWRARRLLTRLRGDTAVAPVGASAQGVPAPAGFLVLKTLTEATAPCSLVSFASSRGHGPFGCPGRQCPLRWPACLGVGSL